MTLPAGHFEDGRLEVPGVAVGAGPLCVFDGFLDNAAELRRELGPAAAASPAVEDLVLACHRRWGDGFAGRLRGDFALLVWDGERGAGLLVRDQLGVRPLFVHAEGRALRFAGEVRDLLTTLPRTPAPDPVGVAHWIGLANRVDLGTLYGGIERVGPGEILAFGRGGVSRRRYWSPRFEPSGPGAVEAFGAEVREGLELAVSRRLDRAGRTGVAMSGGLDSSSIAAVAGRAAIACSGVFPEHPDADERELIEELREVLGIEGIIAEVRPGGLLAAATNHLANWRLPQRGWGDFWRVPLLRASAAAGVITVLGGDGGDELFGPRAYVLADAVRAGRPRAVWRQMRRLPGAGPHVGRRREARMIASVGLAPALPPLPGSAVGGYFVRGGPASWVLPRTRRDFASSWDPDAWKRRDGPRWWANVAHGIAVELEASGVLEHGRRGAAEAGVEPRHPILDLDLVETALRQPPAASLDPRFNRPVLRAAMTGLLPDSVRLRPGKAHFESLIVSGLGGEDEPAIRALLSGPDAALREYVDQDRMRNALFDRAEVREADPFRWMWQVWRLLNMELWLRSLEGRNEAPEQVVAARGRGGKVPARQAV